MQDLVCYILNQYYSYYRIVISYPYLSSELRNLNCLKTNNCNTGGTNRCADKKYCCALEEELFKKFCIIFTKKDLGQFYKAYKCCQNKLRGDMTLRRDFFDYNYYNTPSVENCLKMAIFASFTHLRGNTDKVKLLNSLIEMCIYKKFDDSAKEYITRYNSIFNEDLFIDTDMGEMLNQTLGIIKKYGNDCRKINCQGFMQAIQEMLNDCKSDYSIMDRLKNFKATKSG